LRHHYRHPPASRSRHQIGNSALPPLPPSFNARSHSLDGLLDSNGGKTDWTTGSSANMTAEGLNNKNINNNHKNNIENRSMTESTNQSDGNVKDAIRNTANRRSKSLDDLLDDDQMIILEDEREVQSMENILEKAGCEVVASNESIMCSLPPISSEKMCENEVMMVDNSMLIHTEPDDRDVSNNDSGIQCDASSDTPKLLSDNSSLDDDAISNTVSITSSTASDNKKQPGKTFLNKYVKKVKNLMKK